MLCFSDSHNEGGGAKTCIGSLEFSSIVKFHDHDSLQIRAQRLENWMDFSRMAWRTYKLD